MHISEGILSLPILLTGAVVTAGGVALGLRRLTAPHIPETALLSAAFFVASLVHVPLGPSSVHLVLNGLLGLLLGPVAFPAILVGLFLQAVLFQFGGLTTLGVNTMNMALPAVLVWLLFSPLVRGERLVPWASFAAGALAVALSGLMVAAELALSGESFSAAARLVLAAHLPVMVVEGLVTGFIVGFLKKVRPEMLAGGVRA